MKSATPRVLVFVLTLSVLPLLPPSPPPSPPPSLPATGPPPLCRRHSTKRVVPHGPRIQCNRHRDVCLPRPRVVAPGSNSNSNNSGGGGGGGGTPEPKEVACCECHVRPHWQGRRGHCQGHAPFAEGADADAWGSDSPPWVGRYPGPAARPALQTTEDGADGRLDGEGGGRLGKFPWSYKGGRGRGRGSGGGCGCGAGRRAGREGEEVCE